MSNESKDRQLVVRCNETLHERLVKHTEHLQETIGDEENEYSISRTVRILLGYALDTLDADGVTQ